jgi:predicted ester cyclase
MTRRDQAKDVVRRYVAALNAGDEDALRKLFHADAVIQGVLRQGGIEEVLPLWRQLHDALALHLTIEELVAEGDVVAARYTERGRFRAPFLGQEPTGRPYSLIAMEWFLVRDGRIQRRWGARDAASQARQIGLHLEQRVP